MEKSTRIDTNLFNTRTPDVCIIGAGFSGLCAAIRIKEKLGIETFTVFDRNHDVGGTWNTNTYPGCACDVESHLYSLSFDPNPNWSKNYSSQSEIWQYQISLARKYGLYSHIQFNTDVKLIVWDEQVKKWRVTFTYIGNDSDKSEKVQDEQRMFDIIFNGTGVLRVPNIPNEFLTFKGPLIHSAQWDSTIDLENKTVAVVGSGASALQIIPTIAEKVRELHVYQRQPSWIYPRVQFRIPQFVQTLFTFIPFLMWLFRCLIFLSCEMRMLGLPYVNTINHKIGTYYAHFYRRIMVRNNPKLYEELTPKYEFGCKRIIMSDIFYASMSLPHVKLHTCHIQQVNPYSLQTKDGAVQDIDILILATGYRYNDYFAPLDIRGKNGEDILASWRKNGPEAYFGIISNNIPNLFTLLGPYTSLGHNSVVFQIECQVNFAVDVIREMMRRNARVVTVKKSVEAEYMQQVKTRLSKTVWGTVDCGSWYTDTRGEVTAIWPDTCISYWRKIRTVDFSKFDFEYL